MRLVVDWLSQRGGSSRTRSAWAVVFACLFFAASTVPVVADSLDAPTEPGITLAEPQPSLLPSEYPTASDVAQGIAQLEKEDQKKAAELESSEAAEERADSETAYTDISPSEAMQLLHERFPEEIEALNGDPARFITDSTVGSTLGDGTIAQVTNDGAPALLDADIPVEAPNETGELKKLDLSLVPGAGGYELANPLIDLSLPETASGAIEIGRDGLAISAAGASEDSQGELLGNKNLFYPDVEIDTDFIVSPIGHGVELFDQMRSAESPETLRFDLDLPAGASLVSDGNGGASIMQDQQNLAHISFPTAVDAQGTEVPVSLSIDGSSMVLDVPHRHSDFAYPILVDPSIDRDWYNSSWYGGQNTWALDSGLFFKYNSNVPYIYGATSCMYTCWGSGRGLYVTTPNGAYGGNQFGQWTYAPPGSTSHVVSYLLNPFWRDNHGCSNASYPYPHDHDGLWDGSGWTQLYTGRALAAGNASVYGSWSRAVIFGMGTGPGIQVPCWRDLMVGGMAVWISDPDVPSWNAKPGVAGQWIDTSSIPVSASGSDPGLGVKTFNLWTTDSSGKAKTIVGSAVNGCSGFNDSTCPASWSSTITNYNPSSLPNGVNGMVVIAYDAVGVEHASQGEPIFLKVDHSKPSISLSGELFAAQPGKYHFNITAADGSSSSLASAQSGMKQLQIYFDGQYVGRYPEAENPPACKNVQQGIDLGSCEFKNIPVDLARKYVGKHTLRVVAKDSLDHVEEKIVELNLPADITAPQVSASGPLYAAANGWIGGESSTTIQAQDSETGVVEEAVYVDGKLMGQTATQECFYGGCSFTRSFPVVLNGWSEGAHTVKAVAKDAAGNVGERIWTVKVDSTAPSLSSVSAPEIPTNWTPQLSSLPLKFSASDVGSGIKKVEVIQPVTGGGTTISTPYASACTGGASAPCAASVEGAAVISTGSLPQGKAIITMKAYDAVGRVSSSKTMTVYVDRGAPSIEASGPLVSSTSSTLVGASSELAIVVQDAGSGVASVKTVLDEKIIEEQTLEDITEEGGVQSCKGETCELKYRMQPVVGDGEAPGLHVFTLIVSDQAGHLGSVTREVRVDTLPPEMQLSGALVDAIGTELEGQSASVQATANDGSGEFASGIARIDVSVDGVPVEGVPKTVVADENNNRIQEFGEGGEFLRAFGTAGSGNGQLNRPTGVAIDAKGNIWVADANNNRIQQFNEKGEYLFKTGSAGSGVGQFNGPEGIAIDAKGNLWVADTYNGRLQKFNEKGEFPKVISSKGSGIGQLGEPTALDIAPGGNVWVTDWQNNRIAVFNEAGEFVRQFGTSGSGNSQFNRPDAIDVDSRGIVWVGDQNNGRVEAFNEKGEYITQFGSSGTGEAQFSFGYPMGIASDKGDALWIADTNNNRVQKWHRPNFSLTNTPNFMRAVGSEGGANGQLRHPAGIAMDAKGNLWVADENNSRIQEFGEGGEFLRAFGTAGSGNGQLNRPTGVAIDAKGNIWVADANNNRIQQFNEKGEYLFKTGSAGSGVGQFNGPEGIAIDAKGNLWVADTYNGRLQKFNEKGEFPKVISSKGSGIGQLGEPTALDIAPGGNVWVTDWQNNRIAVFNEAGEFVRQFGTSGSGNGQFNRPDAIDVDSRGIVWVGDQNNGRVEAFNEKGEYITQFGSSGTGEAQFSFGYPMGIASDSRGALWISDTSNNRLQRWQVPNYRPTYMNSFGSEGVENGQFRHPAGVAVSVGGCQAGTCPSQKSKSFTFQKGTWGPGPHTVVMTATDAAGNTDSEEIRVNDPLNVVAPECPEVEPTLLPGGQQLGTAAVLAAIETHLPDALEPSEPYEEGEEEPAIELAPEVTTAPSSVSLDELGVDVSGSLTGGGIENQKAGAFTVGQAVCLEPLEGSVSASNPTIVESSAVVYPNALPDTDSVVRPTAFGATVIEYFHGEEAPESFSWALALKPGEELVKLSDGSIAAVAKAGVDRKTEELPSKPPAGTETLNETAAQIEQAEYDLAKANNQVDGKITMVVSVPEVLTDSGKLVPGIIRIGQGETITAELPPNTVSEAEALIIKANPPAEPEDMCVAVAAQSPEYAVALCGAAELTDEVDDGGDSLTLDSLGQTPNGALNNTINAALSHYYSTTASSGATASYETGETHDQKSFCRRQHRAAECFLFFVDGLEAAEVEDRLWNVPAGSNGTRANAFRHSFWVALASADEDDTNDALAYSIAHEEDQWKSHRARIRKESRMDVLNDFVGALRRGNKDMSSCEIMLSKSAEGLFIGAKKDPFVWRSGSGYEYFRPVYRKLRDLGRPGETGAVVLRTNRSCSGAL